MYSYYVIIITGINQNTLRIVEIVQMFRCITRKKVDTQIYNKTSMFTSLAYQRESLNFIEWSIEGLARSKFKNLYITLLWLFDELQIFLKGWKSKGINTHEESQNVVRIKCRKVRMREEIRTDMKVIQDIQYKGKNDTEYLCFGTIICIESLIG